MAKTIDYEALSLEYSDRNSLQSKKLRLALSMIPSGAKLLDIGSGTGE